MESKYEEYIKALGLTPQTAYGQCEKTANQMATTFPELRVVSGWYYDVIWGQRGHYWLVTPGGEIIDPTAEQFPTRGAGHYEEVLPEDRPTGICPNCGEYTYNGEYLHAECERAYAAFVISGGR